MNRNILYIVIGVLWMMISSAAFLLIFANLLVSSVEAKAKMKKYLYLQELRPCEEHPNMARLNGSFKYSGNGDFFVNLDVFTPRKLDHLFLFVDLKKCPTKVMTADCEDMMSFPVGDQCLANAYFRYLYTQFEPQIICPVNGLYQAKNVRLETDNHLAFFRSLGEEDWLHAFIDVYSDEKKTEKRDVCIVIIAAIRKLRVQVKNNRNKKN